MSITCLSIGTFPLLTLFALFNDVCARSHLNDLRRIPCAGENFWYVRSDSSKKFWDAKTFCRELYPSRDSWLATPLNPRQNACAVRAAWGYSSWLGVEVRHGQFVYISKLGHQIKIPFQNWTIGEPNSGNSSRYCGQIWEDDDVYGWDDTKCSNRKRALCQYRGDFKEELIGCHTSHYLALNAYTLFEWNQAENLCKSLHPTNSFIALPGSEEDMQCLHRLRQTKAVWLGIRYISPDQRTFLYKPRTLDWGSHDLIYKGWRGGLETDREYCSIMARGESRWVSEECNEEHHLICQIRDTSCPFPLQHPERAQITNSKSEFSSNAEIRIHCYHGYYLEPSQRVRRCSFTGKWEPAGKECEPVRCPLLRSYTNNPISVKAGDNSVNSSVFYRCNPGYRMVEGLSNTFSRMCKLVLGSNPPRGEWDGFLPRCRLILCVDLQNPPHGAVRLSGLRYGSNAVYSCQTGYEINVTGGAVKRRTCLANQTWSGNAPRCTDINECTRPRRHCEAGYTCNNTPGSFRCDCHASTQFNGTHCVIDDEEISQGGHGSPSGQKSKSSSGTVKTNLTFLVVFNVLISKSLHAMI